MDRSRRHNAAADDRSEQLIADIVILGVGPGGFDRVPDRARQVLADESLLVIARTLRHPALAELAQRRHVLSGDDLYEGADTFEEVYDQLAARVIAEAEDHPVVFAVPGSPLVGEFTVGRIRTMAAERRLTVDVIGAESFVDAICAALSLDPLERGLQVLDGRDLPDPIPLHVPTIIAQVDVPVVAADVISRLGELLGYESQVTVVIDAGSESERIETMAVQFLDPSIASVRTSLYIEPHAVGWYGAVATMRVLRSECPWDAEQTHQSILANLTEEAAELSEALATLPVSAPTGELDHGAYADVEEELGDVLLQVIFHIVMGEETGSLRPDGVGQVLIDKLQRRHPHVFGTATADSADEVLEIWETAKSDERPQRGLFDGIASDLSALGKAEKVQQRAAQVGFDWDDADPVYAKLYEEIDELRTAENDEDRLDELGDVLFTVVNLARKLAIGSELALRRAVHRFQRRVLDMESHGSLAQRTPQQLEELWTAAKRLEE